MSPRARTAPPVLKAAEHPSRGPSRRPENRARPARHFAGLQFFEDTTAEISLASSGRSPHFSFIVCLQASGRGHVSHDDMTASLGENEAFVVAPLSRFTWRPADGPSRCLIAAGGPAFSRRFRPRSMTAVKLGPRHPVTLLLQDCVGRLSGFVATAESTVTQKIAEVLADLVETGLDDINGPADDQAFLDALLRIEDQLDDPQFDVDALAREIGTTLRSLQKRFRHFKTTPREWMSDRRLERTRRKLDDPSLANLSIKQIAFGTGFRDFSHFSRSFKDAFGVPPRRYRR